MFWLKKRDSIHTPEESEKRERLFFHDIINLTHGIILFLNERNLAKKDIVEQDIVLLEKEIRTLQSLIKDHFHFKHKNLEETPEWVPFSVGELALKAMIQTYLPEQMVKTYISLQGKISYERSLQERESALIYYPIFYRMMNNLIKNMAEAKTDEVHFLFNYFENGLLIETKNKLITSENHNTIPDNIIWLNEEDQQLTRSSGVGLGLESVHGLALELGGRFEVEIVDSYWVNKITLPVRPVKKEQKSAA